MGCTYWVSNFDLPKEMTEEELDKFWLEWRDYFQLEAQENHSELCQQETDMSYSTVSDVDNFILEIAKALRGTKFDPQVLNYNYDSESMGYIIIHDGAMDTTSTESLIMSKDDEPLWLELSDGQKILMGHRKTAKVQV